LKTTVIIVHFYWNKEDLVKFWKIIGSFYEKVRKFWFFDFFWTKTFQMNSLNIQPDYKELRRRSILMIIVTIGIYLFIISHGLFILMLSYIEPDILSPILLNIFFNTYLGFELIYVTPFILTCSILKIQFEMLNTCLRYEIS
jgi:hypothetical protein